MQQQLMCESPGVLIVCQPDISQENDTDSLKMQDTLGCIDRSIMPRLQSFAQQVSVECLLYAGHCAECWGENSEQDRQT